LVQYPARKYSAFVLTPNQFIDVPSRPARGALAIVTNARWDAVDAMAATDERGLLRTAKSCGPDAAVLASSSREASFSGATVARKPFTGEITL
jgi:hypothetical protein